MPWRAKHPEMLRIKLSLMTSTTYADRMASFASQRPTVDRGVFERVDMPSDPGTRILPALQAGSTLGTPRHISGLTRPNQSQPLARRGSSLTASASWSSAGTAAIFRPPGRVDGADCWWWHPQAPDRTAVFPVNPTKGGSRCTSSTKASLFATS